MSIDQSDAIDLLINDHADTPSRCRGDVSLGATVAGQLDGAQHQSYCNNAANHTPDNHCPINM